MQRPAPTRRNALALLAGATTAPIALSAPSIAQSSTASIATASINLVLGHGAAFSEALSTLEDYGQPDILPTLILAMRYNQFEAGPISRVAGTIADEPGRHGWFDWMLWQQDHPEIVPHSTYTPLKLELLYQIDPMFARFLNDDTARRDRMRIRLEEITWGGVPVDGIPSLDNPELIAQGDADYLNDDDLVFGITINGDARAYPLRIMNWHEMFNDVIGDVPVALAYCTLCGAGILFETGVEGRDKPFMFGSSGFLYRSNKLMFDRETDSLWNQFTGRPVTGQLVDSGISLPFRPVVIESWKTWRERNPSTRVLSLDTGHKRDYGPGAAYGDYFASDDLMFPALADTLHLTEKDYVFGIRTQAAAKAWPITAFRSERVINDGLGDLPLVLVGDAATRTVRAFDRGDRTFAASAGGTVADETGAVWSISEDALISPSGERAPRVAGHIAYWFGWNGYLGQDSALYRVN